MRDFICATVTSVSNYNTKYVGAYLCVLISRYTITVELLNMIF